MAALRTALALLVVALYILIFAPPLVLWTAITGRNRLLYRAGDIGVRLGFGIVGIRLRVLGVEHIRMDRPAVYAANHSSNIDPPVVFRSLAMLYPRVRTLYKAELRKIPLLVRVFDAAGFVPVERGNREQSLGAVERAVGSLRRGDSLIIFPEGTRSRTGELLPFKKGGFIMAIDAQVPVVPVAVSGSRDAMRKGSFIMHPVTVTAAFQPAIETTGLGRSDRDALATAVREAIAGGLPKEAQ